MSDTINAVGAERRRTQYDTARPRPRRPEPADPTPAWRRVLRRWPTILSTWLLVLAAALVAGLLWPPTYQATASMTVTPSAVNPLTGDAGFEEVEMQTEMATMASQRITLRAAALLQDVPLEEADPVLAEELLESLSTTAPDDTQVLRVTVDAQDPNLAAERANALADAYLADRGEDVQTTADDTLKRIDESIAGLERTDEDSSSLRQLREQRTALALIAPTPGRVISEATPPQAPSSAGLLLFIAGGLVGGLVLGAPTGSPTRPARPSWCCAPRTTRTVPSSCCAASPRTRTAPCRGRAPGSRSTRRCPASPRWSCRPWTRWSPRGAAPWRSSTSTRSPSPWARWLPAGWTWTAPRPRCTWPRSRRGPVPRSWPP
ncbi:GumC domain-containing protein [Kocuria turfanensis]|uniref:hypothetical protein n=1 Tax=Kocuria turfanensis TaxID=388357 RepID=UPI0009FBB066|nr:hypothetical protein [Kocuria turfanensis]